MMSKLKGFVIFGVLVAAISIIFPSDGDATTRGMFIVFGFIAVFVLFFLSGKKQKEKREHVRGARILTQEELKRELEK